MTERPRPSDPARSTRRWERFEELFEQALALPDEARGRFLDAACAGDPALRKEVEELLAASVTGRALSIERLVNDEPPPAADPWLGQLLGPWRLTRLIGRGGMGFLYRAERTDGQPVMALRPPCAQ